MAIVSMKRILLLGMKEDQQNILKILQKHGSVQISDLNEEKNDYEPVQSSEIERLYWCINYLSKVRNEKKPLFASDVYISNSDAEQILQNKEELLKVVLKCEEIEREKGRIQTEILKKKAEIDELSPFEDLSVSGLEINDTLNTKQILGYIANTALERVDEQVAAENLLVHYEKISDQKGQSYIYIFCHISSYQQAIKIFKDNGFSEVQIPKTNKKIKTLIDDLKHEIEEISSSAGDFKNSLEKLADNVPELERLYDLLNIEYQRQEQRHKLFNTQSTFSLLGWIPENKAEKLKTDLYNYTKNIELEIRDPEEGEEPPVLLQNNSFATPFESVVEGFAYPDPNGFDPTAVMAPFFANFFGMMLSDAGYGLMMLIAIPFIIKKFNPKVSTKNMLRLMLWGGVATVIWGALYNTWFGFSPFPIALDPVNKPMPVMMLCVALGAVHLFAGLGVAAYMNIKKGDIKEAVYSQLSWAILIIGLGMFLLPSTKKVGSILAIVGATTILLTAGRDKKNIFSRFVSGFGALYGVMNWVSDLLSYMRLFGMGLTTGVIGMVINILIGMVIKNGVVGAVIGSILFVGAHLFNFGINALGAYVHSCRLQYIEFFGKFYEDGGKPFVPLTEKTRYIKVSNNN